MSRDDDLPPITRAEAQGSLSSLVLSPRSKPKNKAILEGELEAVEVEGRRRFYWLRSKWSWVIVTWISVLIVFNCAFSIFVGLGWLNFEKYPWFISAVTVETFLQVIGLGYVAAKFLFSRGG